MKFILDENISPYHARALHHLVQAEEGSAQVVPLFDIFPRGTPDHVWLAELQKEGDWIIITKDRFRKNRLEAQVFAESALTAFMMDRQWLKKRYWEQMIQLIRWRPTLKETALNASPGASFSLPWGYSTGKKLKHIRQ